MEEGPVAMEKEAVWPGSSPRSRAMRRRKAGTRRVVLAVLVVLYLGVVSGSLLLRARDAASDSKGTRRDLETRSNHRNRRDIDNHDTLLEEDSDEIINDDERNCTPRAVDEFPANFFTLQQTQDGAVAVHIAIALYMFGALAIVCDDYFVSSLELISARLNLQEDVAGATFMAAGSSAPEFFTSVIGVFIAKSDVGVGTIVGSAVFNILFIIGACGIFAGMVVQLTWWPMMRDCVFYLISIAALVLVINDELVHWYEATVLVVLYIIYIIVMYFNRNLEALAHRLVDKVKRKMKAYDRNSEKQPLSTDKKKESGTFHDPATSDSNEIETSFCKDVSGSRSVSEKGDEYESPWTVPDYWPVRIYWVVMMPIKLLMFVTVPDCRRPGWMHRLYPLTFIMSIAWIAASSFVMVWMVTIAGDALGIPDTVMGLTFLAAGTSVPDCLSSIFVARDGYGDMAVSNSIGSNVFDILLCLGLPWLLDTAAVNTGKALIIHSGGIVYSSLTLLSTVVFLVIAINIANWRLTKGFGVMCFVIYVLVIALSCLYELNIFGDFILPACPR